ncbi:helicase-associated domain-containing protein, partial [Kocuria sp. ZOR0020]|uniref:helicase-associated domain-containing protein n=1 Tax=Kocuria sp. ZOR0020 TaxID=1339234 RepID=UPI000648F474
EGRGAADTFRFSVTSLQRALEHGYDAAALTQLLEHRLGGVIPQSLVHLVDEALRTHGALRIQDAQQVVTGRADLVEALAHAPELDRYQILRPSPEVLILNTPGTSRRAPLKRDPLRAALLSAAVRAGVQPTLGSTTARTPVTDITGDLGQLLMLFTPAAPAAEVLDPDHLRTVATCLARTEQESTDD